MKSSINLYHKEFQPTFEVYVANNLLAITAFFLLFAAAVTGFVEYKKNEATAELKAAQDTNKRAEKEIAEMTAALAARTGDPALQAKLIQLEQDMDTQRQLVSQIQSLSTLKNKSFSQLFDAFSSSYKPQLWLTSFTVNEGDLTIKGEFSTPKVLPNWIASLNQSSFFSGQEFNEALVERDDDVLVFELTSQIDASANGGANGRNN